MPTLSPTGDFPDDWFGRGVQYNRDIEDAYAIGPEVNLPQSDSHSDYSHSDAHSDKVLGRVTPGPQEDSTPWISALISAMRDAQKKQQYTEELDKLHKAKAEKQKTKAALSEEMLSMQQELTELMDELLDIDLWQINKVQVALDRHAFVAWLEKFRTLCG